MALLVLPHYFRIIPRIILILLIVASFGMALAMGDESKNSKVLGLSGEQPDLSNSTINREGINEEIKRTKAVLTARPDYVAAWLRLSVLYEQIGENSLAEEARERARSLTPDL
ncbi:MAG: hypothetical protein Q8P25_04425 [Candidatus Curtissbacteria bacterium]|nr:hypothetical protein [Candidatus Curtissbacteria bacterium]MDZ4209596.1 hypothetical protein [Candidatus Curtissbacteria bacterium]